MSRSEARGLPGPGSAGHRRGRLALSCSCRHSRRRRVVVPRLLVAAAVAAILLATTRPADLAAQGDPAAKRVVAALSPAERVAQLFLVPLDGGDAAATGDAAHLVAELRVGGVYLDPSRGNFSAGPDAPAEVARLTAQLQALAAEQEPFVPLLIALAQKGDGFPDSPLVGGMTPLPSPMALGATWSPEQAEGIGELVGRELAAVGVNLLLAPDLDVLAVPLPGGPGDRGVSSFGGSPQWVGRLGARYVAGVHAGGRGRVATAVGHFPGIGGADRSPEEEVAVVEKTFQELAATELVPYEAVAGGGRPGSRTDALVTSHVRYRGVQQQLDRPLSLDSGGLRYLWAQVPLLDSWRSGGGVLVSPGLGLPAVRRYDDPNLRSFNHRRVIREALAAGHDVLFVANLGDGTAAAELAAIDDGIGWLTTVYGEDEAVRAAVDAAVARVVALKRSLYPDFRLEATAADPELALRRTGVGTEKVRAVARDALTRLAPAGGGAPAPGSPKAGDRVLLVVDARPEVRCRGCQAVPSLDPDALVAMTRRTYGRAGAHRVDDEDVAAVTFRELKAWLQAKGAVAPEDAVATVPALTPERQTQVDGLLRGADWLVFAMRDVQPAEAPGSDALKLFLKSTSPEGTEQRLVALAFGAPYYLDTTEIAKLTAYYAVYSRTEAFLEVAVRAVFGDEPAPGASPVSVSGAGYDLVKMLEPARDDVGLELVGRSATRPVAVGANLTVRTGAIYDGNGHEVPDETPVTFRRFARSEGLFLPDVEVTTEEGHATASVRAERPGELEIAAVFANGLRSQPIVVTVEGTRAATAFPAKDAVAPVAVSRPAVDWGILLLSLGAILLAVAVAQGVDPGAARAPSRLVRLFLISLCWGLAGYLLVAAGGVRLESLAGGRLWPQSWSPAYQAPLFSFVLALLAVIPSVARALRREGSQGRPAPPAEAPPR